MLKAVCQISRGALVCCDALPGQSILPQRAMALASLGACGQQSQVGVPSAAMCIAHCQEPRHSRSCPLLPQPLHRQHRGLATRAKRSTALQEAPPEPDSLRMLDTELHVEAETSYIAYAMSVIVGRALPDVRDGLKPVHRRILYAMHDLGLLHSRPFRKCARVVGEVLGKYHPHGDTAVYDSLVRMAQDFTMQAPLIEGHGNFGSVDNDPPAAMRYTECRLRGLSTALFLDDLPYNTVDMSPTFDGSQDEPTVLPARVPHLLVNGAAGIAVGIATKIPPHNLREVVAAMTALIKDPNISLAKLMKHIPAPDFPTGGEVVGADSIEAAFATGKGHITLRGIATVEQDGSRAGRGKKAQSSDAASQKSSVVITQLPYQTNKAAMVAAIAQLIEKGTLTGISDVQDESDRDGMRVVLDVKRGFNPEVVRNALFQHTGLQTRFNANMVALVGGQPRQMGLKEMLSHFLDFRRGVVQRRSQFSLAKAQARLHTVEGLMKAQADMNTVVDVIRSAPDGPAASQQLQSTLDLSPDQAESVLSMPLRRLTTLEAGKLQEERDSLSASIEDLVKLLASPEAVMQVVAQEAQEVAKKFGTPRRTQVRKDVGGLLSAEEIIPNNDSLVVFSARGYLKRMPADTFTAQKRGGVGVAGTRLRDSDILEQVLHVRDHDHLLFFTPGGAVHTLRAHQVPLASRTAAGAPAAQVLGLKTGLNIAAVLPVDEFRETDNVLLLTRMGMLKKMPMSRLSNISSAGSRAIGLREGDELVWVEKCTQDCSLLIGTSKGLVLHFVTDDKMVQPQAGRQAQGRIGMKLADDDCIVGMSVLPAEVSALCSGGESSEDSSDAADEPSTPLEAAGPCVLLVTEQGIGKLVAIDHFKLSKRALRGGPGLKVASPDRLAALQVVDAERHGEILLGTRSGQMVRVALHALPLGTKRHRGVNVVKTGTDDIITSCTPLPVAQADF